MNLYLIVDFVLLIFVLGGLWVSLYRVRTTILGVITMTLTDEQKKIEIRRVSLIIFLFLFQLFSLHDVYINFNWVSFFSVIFISSLSIYVIFKLSPENYFAFIKKYQELNEKSDSSIVLGIDTLNKENDNEVISNPEDIGEPITFTSNEDIVKEKNNKSIENYKKNIEVTFTEPVFNLLRQFNYINFNDDYEFDDVRKIILNSNQKVFRFKNRHEAKEFYNRIFKDSTSDLQRYLILFGYKYRTMSNEPQSHKFSSDFNDFLSDLEKMKENLK